MNNQDKPSLNKRNFLKVGLGVTGSLIGSKALGNMCGGIKTAEQSLGPFFPQPGSPEHPVAEIDSPDVPIFLANDNDLTFVKGLSGEATGQVVFVEGKITDEKCQPVAGATVIIWQASHSGRYNHKGDSQNQDFSHPITGENIRRQHDPHFQYWGKTVTDQQGNYVFRTIVPGFYPADLNSGWYRPPHIHFMVSATGFPQLVTQMYFRGPLIKDNDFTQELNQKDLILHSPNLSDQQRQGLIVDFAPHSIHGELTGQFDISLHR